MQNILQWILAHGLLIKFNAITNEKQNLRNDRLYFLHVIIKRKKKKTRATRSMQIDPVIVDIKTSENITITFCWCNKKEL